MTNSRLQATVDGRGREAAKLKDAHAVEIARLNHVHGLALEGQGKEGSKAAQSHTDALHKITRAHAGQVEALGKEHERATAKLKQAHAGELERCQKETDRLKQSHASKLDDAGKAAAKLEKRNDKLTENNDKMLDNLTQTQQESMEIKTTLQTHVAEVKSLETERNKAIDEAKRLGADSERLKAELKELRQKHGTVESKVLETSASASKFAKEKDELDGRLAKTVTELAKCRATIMAHERTIKEKAKVHAKTEQQAQKTAAARERAESGLSKSQVPLYLGLILTASLEHFTALCRPTHAV